MMEDGKRQGWLTGHTEVHTSEIWNEPDDPDDHAVAVEAEPNRFAAPSYNPGGPDCMEEHKPDRKLSGERVRLGDVKGSDGHFMHGHRSRNIEGKADPERDDMPRLEIFCQPLGPHAERVEEERQRD